MGTSSTFLQHTTFLQGTGPTGLTTYPTQRRLCCYTCSFAKPCYPVPTECQDDEVCGISIGISEQGETIQWKGCFPRAPCSLSGHATYWSHSYVLRHDCCNQDLWNVATVPQRHPSLPLTTRSSWPPLPGEATSFTSLTQICSLQPRTPLLSPRP